jgi:hypothetical protein
MPFYVLALAVFALVGVVRLIGQQLHWWWLLEQHELRSEAAAAGDTREWLKLHKEAKQTRKVRGWLACGMVLASRRTVVAMAAAAGMAAQFRRACWFFSHAAWDVDDLGVAVARLIVKYP